MSITTCTTLYFVGALAATISVFVKAERLQVVHVVGGLLATGVFSCIVYAAGLHMSWTADKSVGELVVTNLWPYEARFAVSCPNVFYTGDDTVWRNLGPGESCRVSKTFWRAEPKFLVYGQTNDTELTQWLYGQSYCQPENNGEDAIELYSPAGIYPGRDASYEQVMYLEAKSVSSDSGVFKFVFTRQPLEQDISPNNERLLAQQAVECNRSIRNQMAHERQWRHAKTVPFHLGVEFDQNDAPDVLGVRLTAVSHPSLPGGYPQRLQVGDIIVSFSERSVFGSRDVEALLHEHATDINRGIETKIPVVVMRPVNDLLNTNTRCDSVALNTTYFFDRNHFTRQGMKATSGQAFLFSQSDAAVLGLSDELSAALAVVSQSFSEDTRQSNDSFKETRWNLVQQRAMLQQWYGEAYHYGAFAAMPVNLTHRVLGAVGGQGFRRFSGSTTGLMALNLIEEVIYDANAASSIRSIDEFYEEMSVLVPVTAGMSFGQSVLGAVSTRH